MSAPLTARQPAEPVIDTRDAGSRSCVDLTVEGIAHLSTGESLLLVADHDPVGLQYMLQAEQPGLVSWELVEEGPPLWRARIRRVDTLG